MKPILSDEEIAQFRQLNIEEMKRIARINQLCKWLVIASIAIPTGIIYYFVRG